MKYEIKPLTEEEETFIAEKINVYGDSMAPSEPHTEEEQLVFKVEDDDKNVIGGCIVNIHAWGRAVLAQLWVDGQYRHHGLGSMLIRTAENATREKKLLLFVPRNHRFSGKTPLRKTRIPCVYHQQGHPYGAC